MWGAGGYSLSEFKGFPKNCALQLITKVIFLWTSSKPEFDFHYPLEHKLGAIGILHKHANNFPLKSEGKKKEHRNVRTSLRTCGYHY